MQEYSLLLQKVIEAQREQNYKTPTVEQDVINTLLSQLREGIEKGKFCGRKSETVDLCLIVFRRYHVCICTFHKSGKQEEYIRGKEEKINKFMIFKFCSVLGLECKLGIKGKRKILRIKYTFPPEEKTQ